MGGDEFVILFINTTNDAAEDIIVRLQQSLNEYNQKANREYDIEFSFGIVDFDPDKHDSIEVLLEEGDSLMYEYKKKNK